MNKRSISGRLAGYAKRLLDSTEDAAALTRSLRNGPAFGLRPDRNGTLVAGPFVGEFGWELMGWQGYVRRLARAYERTIVIARPSSEYLYRDFATEFRPFDPGQVHTDYYERVGGPSFELTREPHTDYVIPESNEEMGQFARENLQEFRLLGTESIDAPAFDLVIHARSIPELPGSVNKHLRNWPASSWDRLMEQLPGLRVAAIGRRDLAYCPPGVADLREEPLERQCAVLHRVRCCVGPSSGAMHLAALCRTPLVVWTDAEYNDVGGNVQRYLFGWNPLNTPVSVVVRGGWFPDVDVIAQEVRRRVESSAGPAMRVIE